MTLMDKHNLSNLKQYVVVEFPSELTRGKPSCAIICKSWIEIKDDKMLCTFPSEKNLTKTQFEKILKGQTDIGSVKTEMYEISILTSSKTLLNATEKLLNVEKETEYESSQISSSELEQSSSLKETQQRKRRINRNKDPDYTYSKSDEENILANSTSAKKRKVTSPPKVVRFPSKSAQIDKNNSEEIPINNDKAQVNNSEATSSSQQQLNNSISNSYIDDCVRESSNFEDVNHIAGPNDTPNNQITTVPGSAAISSGQSNYSDDCVLEFLKSLDIPHISRSIIELKLSFRHMDNSINQLRCAVNKAIGIKCHLPVEKPDLIPITNISELIELNSKLKDSFLFNQAQRYLSETASTTNDITENSRNMLKLLLIPEMHKEVVWIGKTSNKFSLKMKAPLVLELIEGSMMKLTGYERNDHNRILASAMNYLRNCVDRLGERREKKAIERERRREFERKIQERILQKSMSKQTDKGKVPKGKKNSLSSKQNLKNLGQKDKENFNPTKKFRQNLVTDSDEENILPGTSRNILSAKIVNNKQADLSSSYEDVEEEEEEEELHSDLSCGSTSDNSS